MSSDEENSKRQRKAGEEDDVNSQEEDSGGDDGAVVENGDIVLDVLTPTQQKLVKVTGRNRISVLAETINNFEPSDVDDDQQEEEEEEEEKKTAGGGVVQRKEGKQPHPSSKSNNNQKKKRRNSFFDKLLRHDTDDLIWSWRRIWWRLAVLLVSVTAIMVSCILGLAVRNSSDTDTFTHAFLITPAQTDFHLYVDACHVEFQSSAAAASIEIEVEFAHEETGSASFHQGNRQFDSWNYFLRADQRYLDYSRAFVAVVYDARPTGVRYTDYECSVVVRVPPAMTLHTSVHAMGPHTSPVMGKNVPFGGQFTVSLQYSELAVLDVQLQNCDVAGGLSASFQMGTLVHSGALAGGGLLDLQSKQATVMLTLQNSLEIQLQATISACITGAQNNCVSGTPFPLAPTNSVTSCTLTYSSSSPPLPPASRPLRVQGEGVLHVLAADLSSFVPKEASSGTTTGNNAQLPAFLLNSEYFLNRTSTFPSPFSLSLPKSSRPPLSLDTMDVETIKSNIDQAEVSEIIIKGPGSPNVVWLHSPTRLFFLLIPDSFLNIFSWSLLTPVRARYTARLVTPFCPGLQWGQGQSLNGLDANALPSENLFSLFRLLQEKVLPRRDSTVVFTDEANLSSFDGGKYRILPFDKGDHRLIREVTLASQSYELSVVVLNVFVSVLASAFVLFIVGHRLSRWFDESLEEWCVATLDDDNSNENNNNHNESNEKKEKKNGSQKQPGDTGSALMSIESAPLNAQEKREIWLEEKQHIKETTGVFFWAEFVSGSPTSRRQGYLELTLGVWVHLLVIVLPVLPVLVGIGLFYAQDIEHTSLKVLMYLLTCFAGFHCAFGLIVLTLYYLNVAGRTTQDKNRARRMGSLCENGPIIAIGRLAHRGFALSTMLVSFFAMMYLINVMFWVILGVLVYPNRILPIAAVFLVLVMTLVNTVTRVLALHAKLKYLLKANQEAIDQNPRVARRLLQEQAAESANSSGQAEAHHAIADIKTVGFKDVLACLKKSDILKIVGLTLWQRIWHELISYLILLSFLGFLSVGFFVLSSSNQFVSTLTTVLVFVVGGGVNVPLKKKEKMETEEAAFETEVRKSFEKENLKKA